MLNEVSAFSNIRRPEGFRVKPNIQRKLANSKRRIQRRLDKKDLRGCSQPMMTARNIHYEIAERNRGMASGGIGLLHALARRLGLIDSLDRRLQLLKLHLPYHESDHVLALAYLPLCGGTCLQDLELLRHDEVLLDALGARRLPDPTTAGDFCRRFSPDSIQALLDIINDTRLNGLKKLARAFPCPSPGIWAFAKIAFFGRVLSVLPRLQLLSRLIPAARLLFPHAFDRLEPPWTT